MLNKFCGLHCWCNGDRESDYSVSMLSVLRPYLDSIRSLIRGERYLLVNIDTESFEYAIDGTLLKTLLTADK